ncbi:PilX N-terminal domain-containing pilus assembly protein [Endothiovibrio diazotrophicus]
MLHCDTPTTGIPRRPPPPWKPSRGERGAALIISLIILLVLTVMGVSGIRNATLGESMAFNAQAKSITFQASETALDGAIVNQNALLGQALGNGVIGTNATADYSALVTPPGQAQTVTAGVVATYTGRSIGFGFDYGTPMNNFTVRGTANLASASAQSIHLLGVQRQAAGTN